MRESFDLVGGDAGLSAAVCSSAGDACDLADKLCKVGRGERGDDTVSVKGSACEDAGVVGGVFQRDAVFLEAEVGENLLGGFLKGFTFRIGGVEGVQSELGRAFQQDVGILEDAGDPLCGGDNLIDADLAVGVAVDNLEGFVIEFETGDRAAENSPHLAVELTQIGYVLSACDLDPDRSAYGGKGPVVLRIVHIIVVV